MSNISLRQDKTGKLFITSDIHPIGYDISGEPCKCCTDKWKKGHYATKVTLTTLMQDATSINSLKKSYTAVTEASKSWLETSKGVKLLSPVELAKHTVFPVCFHTAQERAGLARFLIDMQTRLITDIAAADKEESIPTTADTTTDWDDPREACVALLRPVVRCKTRQHQTKSLHASQIVSSHVTDLLAGDWEDDDLVEEKKRLLGLKTRVQIDRAATARLADDESAEKAMTAALESEQPHIQTLLLSQSHAALNEALTRLTTRKDTRTGKPTPVVVWDYFDSLTSREEILTALFDWKDTTEKGFKKGLEPNDSNTYVSSSARKKRGKYRPRVK